MYQHQACIITFPIFNLIKMKLDIMRGKKKNSFLYHITCINTFNL